MARPRKTAQAAEPTGAGLTAKQQALNAALAQIDKQFGKGSVMRLGDDNRPPIQVIPTGSLALDVALGVGGLPKGRVIEIYGPESSGKTTVALHAVASAQRAGGSASMNAAVPPARRRSLTLSTPWTLCTRRRWALTQNPS